MSVVDGPWTVRELVSVQASWGVLDTRTQMHYRQGRGLYRADTWQQAANKCKELNRKYRKEMKQQERDND